MHSFPARLAGLVLATALGYFLFGWARTAWINYWLLTDSREGMAAVTKMHWGGHGRVVYQYIANGKKYTGASSRNWQDLRYREVKPGGESIVYYSASHPWISQLYKPRAIVEGWPVLLIVLPLEFMALMTLIKPNSGWAFNIDEKKQDYDH